MNRQTRRAVISAVIAAGLITPAQSATVIFAPKAPAIIKPAEFWKPHEKKLMLAMPMTMGLLVPADAVVASYRNTYVDIAPPANPAFAACDLGTPAGNRMIVVVAMCLDTDVSAVDVDGTGATFVVTTSGAGRKVSMWRAASTLNPTGTITCTHGSGRNNTTIHVFALYPASQTPTDAVANSTSGATTTITDLAKTIGGFTVLGGYATGAAITASQTGAEAIIEDYDNVIEATARQWAGHHVNTATTTGDDYSITSTGGQTAILGASWL